MAQTTTNTVVSYENVFVSREKKRAKSFDTVLSQAGVRRHFETEEVVVFNETFADEHICTWPREKNICTKNSIKGYLSHFKNKMIPTKMILSFTIPCLL